MQLVPPTQQQALVEPHQIADLVGRTAPVLGGEGVHGDPGDAQVEGPFHRIEESGLPGRMTLGPGQTPPGRPAPVAVHDTGHMGGNGPAGHVGRHHLGPVRTAGPAGVHPLPLHPANLPFRGPIPCWGAQASDVGTLRSAPRALDQQPMSPQSALAIFAAGLAAGTVNVIVGSGSLITFPVLLALGYPPVLANVSNTVGLAPGNVSATVAYRAELVGQRGRLARLAPLSLAGAAAGALLLLGLPSSVFKAAVPVLIALAAVLMAVQPRISARLRQQEGRERHGGVVLAVGVFLTGIYGGYFGAAQGVILIALLAIFIEDDLQRLNGTKNALALTANAVAGLLFIATTQVSWSVAGLIAAGSIIGGQVGGRFGRRLPAPVLRWTVVVVGAGVAIGLAVEWH